MGRFLVFFDCFTAQKYGDFFCIVCTAYIKQVELTYNPHEIGLFPNPAENEIFVNATEFEGMKAQISISSATGQVLQQMQLDAIPGTAIRLPVSELKEGLYFMNIEVEGFRAVTKRFVVARSGK